MLRRELISYRFMYILIAPSHRILSLISASLECENLSRPFLFRSRTTCNPYENFAPSLSGRRSAATVQIPYVSQCFPDSFSDRTCACRSPNPVRKCRLSALIPIPKRPLVIRVLPNFYKQKCLSEVAVYQPGTDMSCQSEISFKLTRED